MHITSKVGTNDATLGAVTSPPKKTTSYQSAAYQTSGSPRKLLWVCRGFGPLSKHTARGPEPTQHVALLKVGSSTAPGVLAWS